MGYKVFTKQGAIQVHKKFDRVCKQFAEANGIVFDRSNLTYGDNLSFSIKFSLEDNKKEAWNDMVDFFEKNGLALYSGLSFEADKRAYKVTGNLNSNKKSRFKVELEILQTGKITYGDVDWIMRALNKDEKFR